ncbi:MAG: FHA domain-containing protein [Proteobacteria bacterium]|nr:FHA domain-containing protein [Pseudomonadota bacterium]
MYKLVICDDEGKISLVPFIRDEVTIGRKAGNAIRLTDRNVSRYHARLFRDQSDNFFVVSLSRAARTKVENRDVGLDPHPVQPGEQIYIGDYKISFRDDAISHAPKKDPDAVKVTEKIGKVLPVARLIMLQGPAPGREYPLEANLYVIGRSTEANLNIDDASISRAHARMDGDDNRWTISDLDSINGIQVNGSKKDDYLLKSGDIIELGTVRFRFVSAGEPYTWHPPKPQKSSGAAGKERNLRPLWLTLAALLLLALFLTLHFYIRPARRQAMALADTTERLSQAQRLLDNGRHAMSELNWEEASRLFAQAQMLQPTDETAKDLKKKANMEVVAHAALSASLEAEALLNWQGAIDEMVKVPPTSYYYDLERTRKLADKLCEDLLYKADFMITSESPGAREVLDQLGAVPEISDGCRAHRNRLLDILHSAEP